MATPHIDAEKGDFAKTVLLAGDPLRAKWIAENFLHGTRQVCSVRNMLGFTGTFGGKELSVMGSGMGMPSMGIYSHELFCEYGVDNIMRIGSAGAIQEDVKLRDVVVAMSASTDSAWQKQYNVHGYYAPTADAGLLLAVINAARKLGAPLKIGNVLSTDTFYRADKGEHARTWHELGVLASDMESAALYMEAAYDRKAAITLLTISDELYGDWNSMDAAERETGFETMVSVALEAACMME